MNEILVIASKFIRMKKIYALVFYLLSAVTVFSQKKSNPKIGRNEAEISSFVFVDNYLAFGAQFSYRLSVIKKLKIGAGGLYGINYNEDFDHSSGYGAVFLDALQFLGHREKWSFGGQIGHGIYNEDYGTYKVKAGLYCSISCNYRAVISQKLLFATSLSMGYRNFHTENQGLQPENYALVGLRFGFIF